MQKATKTISTERVKLPVPERFLDVVCRREQGRTSPLDTRFFGQISLTVLPALTDGLP